MEKDISYIAQDAALLRFHDLGDMMLVFHRLTGTTHMLADPAPAILNILAGRQLDIDSICAILSRDYELAGQENETIADIIGARVDELITLGLILEKRAGYAA